MENGGDEPDEKDHYLQENIAQGNTYRLESNKQMLTLATGLLAFTVTFRPTLRVVTSGWLVYVSWIALALSVVCGIGVMMSWERFYLSYRDCDHHGERQAGTERRHTITFWRQGMLILQCVAFAVGVIGVAVFAAVNFSNVPTPSEHAESVHP